MVKEVNVSGKLEVADVVSFMFYHNYSRVGGMLTGIFGVIALIIAPWRLLVNDWLIGGLILAFGLMYAVFTPLFFYSRAKRLMRTNPVYKNKITYRFNGDMLTVYLYTGPRELLWQDVHLMKFIKNEVLIYTRPNYAFIVPHRLFPCDDDVEILRDFAVRNHLDIPKKRRLEVEIHDDEVRDNEPESDI